LLVLLDQGLVFAVGSTKRTAFGFLLKSVYRNELR